MNELELSDSFVSYF